MDNQWCPVNLSICKQYKEGKCKAKDETECPVNNECSIWENEELLKK